MNITDDMIDPQLRRRAKIMRALMANQDERKIRRMRRLDAALGRYAQRRRKSGMREETEWITRSDGTRLRILVYTPLEPQAGVAGMLYLHGGGYALGSPDLEAVGCRALIEQSDCVVVSPDYRLSTEAPYPAALEDCYAALLWLKDNAERLGVRSDQLAVTGGSAGGGLTAALTLYARDKGEVGVAFQMPLYPMIDDRSTTPFAQHNDAPVWDAATNKAAWRMYLGDLYGTKQVPAYAAPARATDYRGLPPTFTFVGDIDTFHDETVAYVDALQAADVPTEFRVFPGCYHGFEGFAGKADVSQRAIQYRNRWFRRALDTYFCPQPGG
ncbi:alpha/beta hydrolase [Mycobacterium asiaticum]|uniref:Esterase n=1 Tax=Mycobacterium asiaticum TaxID=1790 RepID=A0A1A3MW06_MYCAS|nr:alpha/beta hydrolase [Mycobacterium asiaticum]OBK13716.1 esterase [Mycobacterium asiaticum]